MTRYNNVNLAKTKLKIGKIENFLNLTDNQYSLSPGNWPLQTILCVPSKCASNWFLFIPFQLFRSISPLKGQC